MLKHSETLTTVGNSRSYFQEAKNKHGSTNIGRIALEGLLLIEILCLIIDILCLIIVMHQMTRIREGLESAPLPDASHLMHLQ